MSNTFNRESNNHSLRMSPEFIQTGIVKDNRDPTSDGRLKVWIEGSSSAEDQKSGWITCKYASPFAGRTAGSPNADTYAEFPKSYGFWAVPPDVGTRVFVFFINGRIEKAYWFGGTYDHNMNHQVPGPHTAVISGSTLETNYPVVDYDRNTNLSDPNNLYVDVPMVDSLQRQNLLYDLEKGVPDRSARRQSPGTVYGLSSPRGHHIVLDDGYTLEELFAPSWDDDQDGFQNTEYNNPVNDTTSGTRKNEGIVFRTRSGAQILLSESEGNVFIINRDGTARIEMDADGNVTVLGDRDVAIRAKRDINFFAQQDMNIETVRNLNIKVGGQYKNEVMKDTHNLHHGEVVTDIDKSFRLYTKETTRFKTDKTFSVLATGELKLEAGGGKATLNGNLHVQNSIISGGDVHTSSVSLNKHIHPAGGITSPHGPCSGNSAAGTTGGTGQASQAPDVADDIIVEAFVPTQYEDVVDVNPDPEVNKHVIADIGQISQKALSSLCFAMPTTGAIAVDGYWGRAVPQDDGETLDHAGWRINATGAVVSIAQGYVQDRSSVHVTINHKNGYISVYRGIKLYDDITRGKEIEALQIFGEVDGMFEFEIRRSGAPIFGFDGSVDPGLFYKETTGEGIQAGGRELTSGVTTNPMCLLSSPSTEQTSEVVQTIQLESIITHMPLSGSLRKPASKALGRTESQPTQTSNVNLKDDNVIIKSEDPTPIDWVVESTDPTLLDDLKNDEGTAEYQATIGYYRNGRFWTYQDSLGFKTIGYGHLLLSRESFPNGLTDAEATDLLSQDARTAVQGAKSIAESYKMRIPRKVQLILTEMVFQLGRGNTMGFTEMLGALAKNDYKTAAKEMRNSRWYSQTPTRVEKHARALEAL